MKITVEWLNEFIKTDASPAEIGNELTMLGLELEAIEHSPLGPVLDFKVTPNRGDCLSVFGIARELAAKDSQKYRPTDHFRRAANGFALAQNDSALAQNDSALAQNDSALAQNDSALARNDSPLARNDSALARNDSPLAENGSPLVEIESPDLCPRYVGAVMRGVKVGSSPERIAQRLTACGMRPIDSVVDTTNYVMLELGQPLHAFDLRRLRGGRIVVRTAREDEKMRTLDGVERALTPEMLLICDAEAPVAIAGVMGGENSEVAPDTTEILLESAHFDPVSVRRTRRTLGMSTEASYRFERFVDPELCLPAARRVAELLGSDLSDVSDVYPGRAERAAISVREARWNALLGIIVPPASAAALLTGLGCKVREAAEGLEAVPPSWRKDLQIEEDLVEEIGRLWGYEKIPEALPFGASVSAGYGLEAAFRKRVKASLLRLGFVETLTHTLCAPSALSVGEGVAIRHAASPELSTLRTSLLPGLADVAGKNRGRSLALFEVGRVFVGGVESRSLGLLALGDVYAAHWSGGKPAVHDFYSMKGLVEEFGGLLRRRFDFGESSDARFHPGRRASVLINGSPIGTIGELAPAICESLDLPSATMAAEIDLHSVMSSAEESPVYRPLSPFPSIRRDFAVVMPADVTYGQIESALVAASEGLAERVWLFDVYEGKGIEPGHRSMGVGVTLRHSERTLTDEEANAFTDRGFSALEALGGKRRA